MKVQITGLSVDSPEGRKFSTKFNSDDPWIFEVEHHSQMNGALNDIREVIERVFRAKYGKEILIHLITKRI